MGEIEFMRWLTSVGIFDENLAYRHTCDPIRGFYRLEDDCDKRLIIIFDASFNEVHKVLVDAGFNERAEDVRTEISKIFEL